MIFLVILLVLNKRKTFAVTEILNIVRLLT